ncbi:MAG: DNA integrity scanning protein DisA nucleotide-binding domain protein [Candidatus Nanoarchaeia archaeon]|nr:DNA integrity scanning protein DisA nucleotide-binding domain protein [Candidatus Nanoarchaeia archaeon]MDD5740694.1 DNA integrity scanning protein DisA nucleotide-binding domain protein [Candidatus Nanoarchaeia archaeon]
MKSKEDIAKKIEKEILEVSIEITKKGEGALFVIGNNIRYTRLLKQKFRTFNVLDKGARKVLVGIATIDGAVIIDKKGNVKDYGAMIKNVKAFKGYGTRHSAAISASKDDNTSILCSEEEKKVKIFKNGRYIMQVDALEKGIEDKTSGIATMLETIGAGFIGTIGVVTLAPTLGIALVPGVIIFGGSYYAIKRLLSFSKK